MKKLALALLVSALAVCARAADDAKPERFKTMHVADLAAALKSDKAPVVYDANTKGMRKKAGVIPGALLLSNYRKFDTAKELPADKATPLVFYCANPKCMASHEAADKASGAGYTDVSVMVDGIMGWRDAGQPTTPLAKAQPARR